ncbi:MAG: hypothetical protein ACFB0E_16250 [Leptolyngbyaceae cyanobacterium]
MLNQFTQVGIQIRNIGLVATGCLIDGLMAVVGGFHRQVDQLLHHLSGWASHRDRDFSGRDLPLTYQCPTSQSGKQLTPRLAWQWQQG